MASYPNIFGRLREPVLNTELALKIVEAKAPKCELNGEHFVLDLDGEKHIISDTDADLLFRTMFFRGKF